MSTTKAPTYLWEIVYDDERRELVEASYCYNGGGMISSMFGGGRSAPETHDFVKEGFGLVLTVRKDRVAEVRRLDLAPVPLSPEEPAA